MILEAPDMVVDEEGKEGRFRESNGWSWGGGLTTEDNERWWWWWWWWKRVVTRRPSGGVECQARNRFRMTNCKLAYNKGGPGSMHE